MTIGKSRTVEQFLKEAAKHRTFQVIVVETAPLYVMVLIFLPYGALCLLNLL